MLYKRLGSRPCKSYGRRSGIRPFLSGSRDFGVIETEAIADFAGIGPALAARSWETPKRQHSSAMVALRKAIRSCSAASARLIPRSQNSRPRNLVPIRGQRTLSSLVVGLGTMSR
jgi:hypothetical protein